MAYFVCRKVVNMEAENARVAIQISGLLANA